MPRTEIGSIFVVEDEDAIRDSVTRKLRSDGYKVLEAGDGREALEVIKNTPEPYFLLITDLDMPNMNGKALIEEIDRCSYQFEAFILISGHVETHPPIQELLARKTGAPLYALAKAFGAEKLSSLVEQISTNLRK